MSPAILSKKSNKYIGKAMHDYSMLADGDNVLIAVSGGVDSSVLAWVLQHWLKKAPINYSLKAVYIDNGFWKPEYGGTSPAIRINQMMAGLEIEFITIKGREMVEDERTCFLCARSRRSQLFDLAKDLKMNKIALGHHKDDLLETLFLNMLYSGNISTMVPKQELFQGELQVIRPLAYLEKKSVREIAACCGIQPIDSYCTVEKDSRREKVRHMLEEIYSSEPGAKASLFKSMANVRKGYML